MNALLDFPNPVVLTAFGVPTTLIEVLGFFSGAFCVWLVARQHIANWPLGIFNCVMFILLFAQAGLYADATLQLVFITLGCYGWWNWVKGGGPTADTLPVSRTSRNEWIGLVGAGLLGLAAITLFLTTATDSDVPFWDALTTVLSLMATYGQCRKRIESWYLWIAADVVFIPLYAYKGLYLTAILYIGFMALCVVGLLSWRKDLLKEREPAEVAA